MRKIFWKFKSLASRQPQLRRSGHAVHAGLGGAFAVFCLLVTTLFFEELPNSQLLVASMGASAVLLFSVPDAPLSQPWNVLGGQVLSAAVGVSCARVVPSVWLAAALAVGLSIGLMSLLACTHPPGGATALSAVMSGPSVHAMGYQFVLTPVLINTVTILLVAMIFHRPRRRYPFGFATGGSFEAKSAKAEAHPPGLGVATMSE